MFDEETGLIQKRGDQYEKREDYTPPGGGCPCPPMCRTKEGCPKGTPENPRSLNEANERAYEHYRECKAIGEFPKDSIVIRNAVIISEVLEEIEAEEKNQMQDMLKAIVGVSKKQPE